MSFGAYWLCIALCLLAPGVALSQDAPSLATADESFALLAEAFESRDQTLLTRLLAPAEIRVQLALPSDRQPAADLYSAEQVLYMLVEFLRGLEAPAQGGQLELAGHRSTRGTVVCECDGLRARNGRAQGVLHLMGERDRRIVTQRLYLSLREDAVGWRVVELRLLP